MCFFLFCVYQHGQDMGGSELAPFGAFIVFLERHLALDHVKSSTVRKRKSHCLASSQFISYRMASSSVESLIVGVKSKFMWSKQSVSADVGTCVAYISYGIFGWEPLIGDGMVWGRLGAMRSCLGSSHTQASSIQFRLSAIHTRPPISRLPQLLLFDHSLRSTAACSPSCL